MLSFLHPGFLYVAAAAAAGIVALHFLVTEQPKVGMLPTVRFFPDLRARATTLTLRLSDVMLLALRVALVLLIGVAFAQPQLTGGRAALARIMIVDVSRMTADVRELADSVRPYLTHTVAVVLFDSTAREMSPHAAMDSLAAQTDASGSPRPTGRLSPALIVALRAASRAQRRADSLEIVLVSPLMSAERDAATLAIRDEWPGRIRIVRVTADTAQPAAARTVTVQWADSARAGAGATAGERPLWTQRNRPDTVGAVATAAAVLVHPFERKWVATGATSGADRVTGRWYDGEPAVVERVTEARCLRSIGFSLPTVGDAILRPAFVRFVRSLTEPCGSGMSTVPLDQEFVTAMTGPPHLAARVAVSPPVTRMTPLVPWLLAAALVLALLEIVVRRASRVAPEAAQDAADPADDAQVRVA